MTELTKVPQDVDGYISPREMRGLLTLFLPLRLGKDEDYLRDLLDRMDRNNDGMIAYEEFVQTIKETANPDFFRYRGHTVWLIILEIHCRYYDPVLKAAATIIGLSMKYFENLSRDSTYRVCRLLP